MDAPRFVHFGPDHLAALVVIAAATLAAVRFVRRDPRGLGARRLALGIAALLPCLWVAENLGAWLGGWLTWQVGLPLQMCDVALILAFFSLVTRRIEAIEPLYFFAFAGTLPALVTPDIQQGFPDFHYFIYFAPHGLTVVSAVLLVVGLRHVPRRGAWLRGVLALNLYAVAITPLNLALGTNFLFLRAKPLPPTPFDWLGPWPFYIVTLEGVCIASFFLLEQALRPLRERVEDGVGERATAE